MTGATARYFVAILPPDDVSRQAREWQQEIADRYGSKASLRSPPHITLHMPFLWKESREEELIGALATHIAAQEKFSITLEGIGAFEPRVIFINVIRTDVLTRFQKELTRFFRINFDLYNANYRDEPFHPHLTLAFRDLHKSDFAKAWNDFRERQLRREISVTSISVLKHTGKEWLAHRELDLGGSNQVL